MDAAWVHSFPDWHRPWSVPFWAARSTVAIFEMRLLDEQNHARIWIVVTAHDAPTRDALINSLEKWQIIDRHEFARTSVLLATPRQ